MNQLEIWGTRPFSPWQSARWEAFRSAHGERAFGSIAGHEDVWSNDPADEQSIHAEARQTFRDLLAVSADRERPLKRGRILLLKGDAGTGKTHLMGALRREVEQTQSGYFTYAQMSTGVVSLWQYLLRNVVDSLQRCDSLNPEGAWLRLSDGLVEHPCVPAEERDALRYAEEYLQAFQSIRARLLEALKNPDPTRALHGDFLAALIALQRRDGNATNAAMKYLRGQPLQPEELAWLGCAHELAGTGDAPQLFQWLLQTVRTCGPAEGCAFVICIDQIEELFDRNAPEQQRFPEMIATVSSLADQHPGLLVVLACLEDFFDAMRSAILPTHLDRIDKNPPPVILKVGRTEEEVLALVRRRLELLDAEAGVPAKPGGEDEIFPFSRDELARLQGSRPRAILAECYAAWQRSRRTGERPEIKPAVPAGADAPAAVAPKGKDWLREWNDARTAWTGSIPKAAAEFASVLAAGINALGQQTCTAIEANAAADLAHFKREGQAWIGGICEGASQGGKVTREVESLTKTAAAAGSPAVAIRSTPFAKTPKAQVFGRLKELEKSGGFHLVFPEADWRTLQVWEAFARKCAEDEEFERWVRAERPLAGVVSLAKLVQLDELAAKGAAREAPVLPESGAPDPSPLPGARVDELTAPDRIALGTKYGLRPEPLDFQRSWFSQHVAVLGGTGSGKTTSAMVLLEGLLLRGVPVILVDRKGDLARYADAESLVRIQGGGGAKFREAVKIDLFTPGETRGRPLALSVMPARVPAASSQEIRARAAEAAGALASMLGYGESRAHTALRATLQAAIGVLLEMPEIPATLDRLLFLLNSEDPALLQSLGYLDHKHLATLVQNLEAFRTLNERLLGAGAEPLDAELLLGLGAHATGRTQLTVISTKFLGGNEVVQFWVAQLMMELARFASAHPSRELQAVIMLDEADLYLPAVGKPASRQPVENALRRFRSGGLGLVLATQSPGDFDYRCRENIGTWIVGRVGQRPALEKLRPVFGDAGGSALEKLGQHATGEFCLVRPEQLVRFSSHRNLLPTDQLGDEEILRAAAGR